jgi:hypothetical protein
MNELKLIALYYYICECYDTELKWHCQRFSNYHGNEITDEEILTIYLFAIIEEEKFKNLPSIIMRKNINCLGFLIYPATPTLALA